MLCKMKAHITGTRDGAEWPPAGGTIEVPDAEGNDLITAGLAEEVTDAPTPTEDGGQPAADEGPAPVEDGDGGAPVEDGESTEPLKPKGTRRGTRKAQG